MGRVDGAPPERTNLPHSQPGLGHQRDHRPPANPLIGPRRAIKLAGDGEQLGELVSFEEPTGGAIRLETASLASRGVAREESVLDRGVENVR